MTHDAPIAEIESLVAVSLPKGTASVTAWHAAPENAWAWLAVAHGAGGNAQHPFFDGLIAAAHAAGIATVRFNFPYSQAGRRLPGPASHALATWAAIAEFTPTGELPLFASGKSYGGRMASMAAAESMIDPAGLVYLGYPLHPPGEPSKLRTAHLAGVAQPQLFVSGTADPFVDPPEQLETAVASCQNARLEWIAGGGHSFEVKGAKRSPDEIAAGLVALIEPWMRAIGPSRSPAFHGD
ncbi:alpha/beta family hydrolase [Microbacterium sp. R86528]|uniref:alpha/beta hydrolase family protein n=1 Tax=Microbacterium sp. R86528 TaxID=3093864 RepID=UPI0037C9F605